MLHVKIIIDGGISISSALKSNEEYQRHGYKGSQTILATSFCLSLIAATLSARFRLALSLIVVLDLSDNFADHLSLAWQPDSFFLSKRLGGQ
jgi:hypothetical protein